MRVQFVITPMIFDNDEVIVDDLSEKEIDNFLSALEAFVDNHFLSNSAWIDIYKIGKYPKKIIGRQLL